MSSSRLVASLAALVLVVGSCRDATAPQAVPDGGDPSFALTASSQTVQVDAFVTLTFDYNGNKTSTWKSSDTAIATVAPQSAHIARVYGKRPGSVTITATAGNTVNTIGITVVPVPVATVTLTPDSVDVQRLDSVQFAATPRDASGNALTGRTVTWRSTDTSIASISSAGRAAARARGTTSIIATVEGKADTSRLAVRQPQLTVTSISGPDSAWSGDPYWFRYTVQNLWDSPAADSTIVRIGIRDAAGNVVSAERRKLPRLTAGAIVQDSVILFASGSAATAVTAVVYIDCRDGAPGTTNVVALAACLVNPASAGTIAEGDETDNTRSATVNLKLPNLMIISLRPAGADTVFTRGSATRQYKLHNQGSAAGAGFDYIVGLRDQTAQSYVAVTGGTYSELLGTRRSDTVDVTLSIPSLDPTHAYQFHAVIDCPVQGNPAARLATCFAQPGNGSVIPELDETDNRDVYDPFVVATNIARVVAPDSLLMTAIGDTTRLTPSAYDRANVTVADAAFTFQSLDPSIVSATAGLLTARAAGVARIVSTSEGRADTSRVYVVQSPARVVATPATVTLFSFGDTAVLSAVVQDRNGNAIPGAQATWTSLDPSVASVVAPGRAVAQANGSASIVAEHGGFADTSVVTVAQRLARIVVSPDSAFLEKNGDSIQFVVSAALDARDNPFVGSYAVTWTSLDPNYAHITPLGKVYAIHLGLTARIIGRSGTVADTSRVRLGGDLNPVPHITSLSPASAVVIAPPPLLTINGTGFNVNSIVQVNGSARTSELISSTQIRTQLLASDVGESGSTVVAIYNPEPAGGGDVVFLPILAPDPVITSSSPTGVPMTSGDTTITLHGTGFVPQSRATLDGVDAVVTFVSGTEIKVKLPSERFYYPHLGQIVVTNYDLGDLVPNVSPPFNFEIRGTPPVIDSLSTTQAPGGQSWVIVRVYGKHFFQNTTARLNGGTAYTMYSDSTTLDVVLSDYELRELGTFPFTVFTNGPGAGSSNAIDFTVTDPMNRLGSRLSGTGTSFMPSDAAAGGQPSASADGLQLMPGPRVPRAEAVKGR